jgi:hypothetical protein
MTAVLPIREPQTENHLAGLAWKLAETSEFSVKRISDMRYIVAY